MEIAPALYMIPVGISDVPTDMFMPRYNLEVIKKIKTFIVENIRTSRRFLKKCDRDFDIASCVFHELNRHTDPAEIAGFLETLRQGEPVGVMSEAGCPGVADPGSDVVAIAQREGLKVVPLVGPSSIIMSLMASGFNGQSFCFNGYLPIENSERKKKIHELEEISRKNGTTQIFIETPYRNLKMLQSLVESLHGNSKICVACEIGNPDKELIITKKASEFKRLKPDIDKRPCIFLISYN